MVNQHQHIETTRREIDLPGLGPAFDGFRIVHLSDIHHGRHVPVKLIAEGVAAANAAEPDLVAITGDFVTGGPRFVQPCADVLRDLTAPEGVIAVLGNHDHWAGADTVVETLAGAGIRVLRNEHRVLVRGHDRLAVIGVEDLWTGGPDLDRAIDGLDAGVPRLLLTHNPDLIEELPEHGIGLALSGHTHGGQIGVPVLQGLAAPSRYGGKYAAGLVAGPTTRVYVNRGLGTVGLALRILCRPEVAVLVLRPAPADR